MSFTKANRTALIKKVNKNKVEVIKIADPEITLLVGPAGCGKTTLAENIISPNIKDEAIIDRRMIYLNTDKIRFRVLDTNKTGVTFEQSLEPMIWDEFYESLENAIKTRKNILVDNTNCTYLDRYNIISRALKAGYKIKLIVFKLSLRTILERDSKRERHVPESVIARQFTNLNDQYPKPNEYHTIEEIKE